MATPVGLDSVVAAVGIADDLYLPLPKVEAVLYTGGDDVHAGLHHASCHHVETETPVPLARFTPGEKLTLPDPAECCLFDEQVGVPAPLALWCSAMARLNDVRDDVGAGVDLAATSTHLAGSWGTLLEAHFRLAELRSRAETLELPGTDAIVARATDCLTTLAREIGALDRDQDRLVGYAAVGCIADPGSEDLRALCSELTRTTHMTDHQVRSALEAIADGIAPSRPYADSVGSSLPRVLDALRVRLEDVESDPPVLLAFRDQQPADRAGRYLLGRVTVQFPRLACEQGTVFVVPERIGRWAAARGTAATISVQDTVPLLAVGTLTSRTAEVALTGYGRRVLPTALTLWSAPDGPPLDDAVTTARLLDQAVA